MKKIILICLSFFMFATSFTVYANEEHIEKTVGDMKMEHQLHHKMRYDMRNSVNAWSKKMVLYIIV